MNWNQIEAKWAAMARRVRSDLPELAKTGPQKPHAATPRATPPGDLPETAKPPSNAEVDAR